MNPWVMVLRHWRVAGVGSLVLAAAFFWWRADVWKARAAMIDLQCQQQMEANRANLQESARRALDEAQAEARRQLEIEREENRLAIERIELARQTASDRATALEAQLNATYEANADARIWRDTTLPAAVSDSLRQ